MKVRRHPSTYIAAGLLSFALCFSGLVLLLDHNYYNHVKVFDQARQLATLSEWGAAMLLSGLSIPLIFSRDAWRGGIAGATIGFVTTSFLSVSFVQEGLSTGAGWFSLSNIAPVALACLAVMVLSTHEHLRPHATGGD